MGKGNKPQKNDKASKKPKKATAGGAKKLGVKKAPTGISIYSRQGDSAVG